jgi:hypothetical protein
VLGVYGQWHPQVVHDLHESIPFLYISTGTGPYNAWLDPLIVDEWHRMAYHEVQQLTAIGLPGVWTHGFYDGWAPNYMFWLALGRNSVGRFYETFGNSIPDTERRVVRTWSQRAWYRPNPPLPDAEWSLRNNINYQQSGLLLALGYMAENREHFLRTFYTVGRRSVAKPVNEGPAAYVFDGAQKRQGQLRDLMELLRRHGVEVHRTDRAFTAAAEALPRRGGPEVAEKAAEKPEPLKFAAGSFVIRMDQPYSRLADTLLDTQFVRGEERVYDDTGWTFGYTKNLEFRRVTDRGVLSVPMKPWDGEEPKRVKLPNGWIVAANAADTDFARFRFALGDVAVTALSSEWKTSDGIWPAGSLAIEVDDANRARVESELAKRSIRWVAAKQRPPVALVPLPLPRVALLHTWLGTQDEGWYRLALDDLGVGYDYISTQDIARDENLLDRYDVVLFPPVGWGADSAAIVNGLPPGPPIPWRKSELTPNLGRIDSTDDMRPGLGIEGVLRLRRFVERGGTLITVRDTAKFAVDYGFARYVSVVTAPSLKARGSILQGVVSDRAHPVAFGYDETLPLHYSGSPVFRVGVFTTPERDTSRPTGRGTAADPDLPQGRPFVPTPDTPQPPEGEEGFQLPEDMPYRALPRIPAPRDRPRVVVSFGAKADELLLSGMLEGGSEIAKKPVVIDAPLGKGHVLLFATNPMWRANTQGLYPLVLNALVYHNALDLGRAGAD